MTEALIRAEHVSVTNHDEKVLVDVSLELKEGDFVSVVGPNGAGKTTLLKVLMGVLTPATGRCHRRENLRIGYMPQSIDRKSFIPLSVRRFIRLYRGEERDEFASVCEDTGITHLLHRGMSELSGGEMQRVLLARSLMDRPHLLVLDEPAQNLDVAGQLAFYRLLDERHRKQSMAVLMVTHDLHIVMASTRKVVCLYHHICCVGEPQTVAEDPEFISLFGENMAQMMSIYTHTHEHKHENQGGAEHA